MKVPFVDLKAHYQSIKPQIDEAISAVFNSGNFIKGEFSKKFEHAFSSYIGLKKCVLTANGSDALEIALRALGIGFGDEVIVPSISWIATANAVKNVGAEPRFIDVHPREFTLNTELLEDVITDNTKAILPVHLYGLPVNMNVVTAIAKKYNLFVVEDCAQAHGASIDGQKVGTFGDVAIFSFYPTKNLGAFGHAGCVVSNNDLIAEKCELIANHGQTDRNDFQIIGRNSGVDEIQAACLLAKMPFLEHWIERRNSIASYYNVHLSEEILRPKTHENYRHVFHHYTIKVKNRVEVMRALEDKEIGFGIYYPQPLPLTKPYIYQNNHSSDFVEASRVCKEIISLPIYPEMQEEDMQYVVNTINNL